MKSNFLFIIFIFSLLLSCSEGGYKTAESGLKYKFITSNSGNPSPIVGDVIAIKLKYSDENDRVIDDYPLFRTQLKKPSHKGGSIEDALAMMHKGDSALFLIKAEDYYTFTLQQKLPQGIKPEGMLHFQVKMVEITPYEEFKHERQVAKMSGEKEEEQLLNDYLKRANITEEPTNSGLYFIETQKGTGDEPMAGKSVTVHYLGYFIDGQIFDSSYDRKEPFSFRLGIGEVIQGWDEGIAKMHVGGKARLIIPSYLAYGDKQSGAIPPFSTLIFDVELLSVSK